MAWNIIYAPPLLNTVITAVKGALGLSGFSPNVGNSGSSATISPHSTPLNFVGVSPTVSVNSGSTAFDFYIAPNGDDNNTGSLSSPWSITALNSKQATYSGKKIGIIGDIGGTQTPIQFGTIGGVQTLLFTIINANANQPALAIDGGTSGAPTYVASCNSSGAYTPRWAQIDARNGSSFNTNTSGVIMGQSADSTTQVPHPGWLTIDGLTIQGFSNSAITLYYTARTSGLIIQNCEIFNGSCSTSGNNPGAIKYSTTSGLVITNNKIHDLVITGGGGSPRWGLLPITGIGNSTGGTDGTVITNNTLYNCSGILQKDGNTDFANCSYNYIDHGIFGSAANSDTGIAQGSLISQQPSAGVTSVFHHNICLGMMWLQPQGTTQFRGTMQFFNNTFYGTPAYGAFWMMDCRFGISPASVQFFNNLIAATNGFAGGSGAGSLFVEIATVSVANPTFNNNVYMNGMTFGTVNDVTLPSFAQWKTNTGCDVSSVVLGSGVNPFSGTPTAQTPSTFATNANAIIGSTTCGALDGTGSVGCNF